MEYFSTLIVRASSAQTSFSMEYPQNIWLDEAAHGTRRYLFRIRAQCGIRQSGSKRSSWARARHQQRHWHYFEMAERVAYLFIFLCFALARQLASTYHFGPRNAQWILIVKNGYQIDGMANHDERVSSKRVRWPTTLALIRDCVNISIGLESIIVDCSNSDGAHTRCRKPRRTTKTWSFESIKFSFNIDWLQFHSPTFVTFRNAHMPTAGLKRWGITWRRRSRKKRWGNSNPNRNIRNETRIGGNSRSRWCILIKARVCLFQGFSNKNSKFNSFTMIVRDSGRATFKQRRVAANGEKKRKRKVKQKQKDVRGNAKYFVCTTRCAWTVNKHLNKHRLRRRSATVVDVNSMMGKYGDGWNQIGFFGGFFFKPTVVSTEMRLLWMNPSNRAPSSPHASYFEPKTPCIQAIDWNHRIAHSFAFTHLKCSEDGGDGEKAATSSLDAPSAIADCAPTDERVLNARMRKWNAETKHTRSGEKERGRRRRRRRNMNGISNGITWQTNVFYLNALRARQRDEENMSNGDGGSFDGGKRINVFMMEFVKCKRTSCN